MRWNVTSHFVNTILSLISYNNILLRITSKCGVTSSLIRNKISEERKKYKILLIKQLLKKYVYFILIRMRKISRSRQESHQDGDLLIQKLLFYLPMDNQM